MKGEGKRQHRWHKERLGLIMILASLAVIGVIIALMFAYQQQSREEQIRSQGVSLTRLLSGMSMDQLIPAPGRQGILQVLRLSQSNPDFAYSVVVDAAGRPLTEVSAPGTLIPETALPPEPSSWLGERVLVSRDDRPVLEFHSPVMSAGQLRGYIRLGYFMPGYGLSLEQVPFFATLALPIFLLTPLFHFLIRREIRPLQKVNSEIERLMEDGSFHQVEVQAGGELREFMDHFNSFVELARKRIAGLQSEQAELVTSTKLLSYKRGRVEAVLQALPEAVMVLDESGAASYANARLGALLGVAHDEVTLRKPRDWCRIPEVLRFLGRFEGHTGAGYVSESLEFSPENAPEKTLEVSAYPLFSPNGRADLLGTLVVFRDVTEESLARRSRGEFVAQVAHELKTPLNVLAMYSESLLGDDGRSEQFRVEAVNVIHDEVERLSTLINNLLSLTRFEMGGLQIERSRVRVNELLEDAFANVAQSGRGRGLDFRLDLPRELSALFVDKDLLRIAVNNLLTNAIKYNRAGGSVVLKAEENDEEVRIRVRDTGLGIAAEEQELIFDKFYRSNDEAVRVQGGHGLGLPMVRSIVQLHHGELELHSVPGEGSEFVIRFAKDTGVLKQAV